MSQIVVDEVCATFGEGDAAVQALNNISLTVEDGQFTSIIGPSGCGKTTLLRVCAQTLRPTSGRVDCGRDGGRGIVFQEHRLLPWRTIRDNVAFGLQIRGEEKGSRRAHAERYIGLVGLQGFADRYPRELSGGMKQRANLARALAIDPDVLLMDEPFASLDSQTREVMQSELLRVWERTKKTVLFVTHQIDEAIYMSDRVVVLSARPGRIKADIEIDTPRPRDLESKRTPEFIGLVDEIWKLLDGDVTQEERTA